MSGDKVVTRSQCINCERKLLYERSADGSDPQVCVECRSNDRVTAAAMAAPGIPLAPGPVVLRDPREWVDRFIGHIVVNLITSWPKEQQAAYWEQKGDRKGEPKPITVSITIDGFEADFRKFAEECERQLDRMIVEKAGEMLKEQLGEELHEMLHVVDQLGEGLKRRAAEMLGYDPWERGR